MIAFLASDTENRANTKIPEQKFIDSGYHIMIGEYATQEPTHFQDVRLPTTLLVEFVGALIYDHLCAKNGPILAVGSN